MRLWNRLPLAAKLLLPICTALVIGLAASTLVVATQSGRETEKLSMALGRAAADQAATAIQLRFETAFRLARLLAQNAATIRTEKGTREMLARIALDATQTAPDLVGSWIEFAPDAFDGADKDHADPKRVVSDSSGRASLYAVNSPDGVKLQQNSDAVIMEQDYFTKSYKSGKEEVTEPYIFPVNGQDVLMTSLTVPIVVDGKTLGTAGVDIDLSALNAELATMKPLGDGSVYLISSGGLWVSYKDPERLGKKVHDTQPSLDAGFEKAAAGETHETTDFSESLQSDVNRLFIPVKLGRVETPWVVMSNLVGTTVDQPTRDVTRVIEISSAVLVVLLALVMAMLVRYLASRPVRALAGVVNTLADGKTDVAVPGVGRGDELGVMAKAIEFFRQKLTEIEALRRKTEDAEREAAAARRRGMLELADSFEASVQGVVQAVSASAVELESNAQSMASVAEEATRQAAAVAAATTEASTSVTTVASASEELSASISEISRQVNDSSTAAKNAVTEVESTGSTMSELAAAAAEIGGIVKLIGDIAGQTNLLALNATIEAARAGDAGKGFAVVASEVKSLANQTAKAAEEITGRISRIQSTTESAVNAMSSVKTTISRVNEIAAAIAAAVEEQTAATKEISGNATQAASGTEEVARNISGVSRAAEDAGGAASQVREASGELAKQAEALRKEVDTFIAKVRAG
ncbi:methyl-accepting chemotaxis protein [Dongia sp. agr-C8]